jgi:hypothetical protein
LPTTPNNLSATVNGTAVSLAWSPVDAAADYVLHIGTMPSGSDVLLVNTSESSHALEQMQPGTLYVSVRSHNWCGTSDASEPVAFTVKS